MAQEFWIFLISGLALLIFALAWLVIMLISKFLTKIVYSYPSQNQRDAIQCTISLRYVKDMYRREQNFTHPTSKIPSKIFAAISKGRFIL